MDIQRILKYKTTFDSIVHYINNEDDTVLFGGKQ